jgi:hypothetical protein
VFFLDDFLHLASFNFSSVLAVRLLYLEPCSRKHIPAT